MPVVSQPVSAQAPAHNQTLLPTTPPGILPSLVRTQSGALVNPRTNPQTFIDDDLDVSILERLAPWLWLAGRINNIRPLHHQRFLGREIVITERAKAHLVWAERRIFLKPLPEWLLNEDFVKANIAKNRVLRGRANGFLRTYLFLIQYESDFFLAKDLHLIPGRLSWSDWVDFVDSNRHLLTSRMVNMSPRYFYGELRLNRINMLYRLLPPYSQRDWFRGYLYGSANYTGFVSRNFAWLLIAFVYITIILTAMQVGLATPQLGQNSAFRGASYGFSVFSIIVPLAAVVVLLIVSTIMVLSNTRNAFLHWRRAMAGQKGTSEMFCRVDLDFIAEDHL